MTQSPLKKKNQEIFKKKYLGDFPSGTVVKTLHFQRRGRSLDP